MAKESRRGWTSTRSGHFRHSENTSLGAYKSPDLLHQQMQSHIHIHARAPFNCLSPSSPFQYETPFSLSLNKSLFRFSGQVIFYSFLSAIDLSSTNLSIRCRLAVCGYDQKISGNQFCIWFNWFIYSLNCNRIDLFPAWNRIDCLSVDSDDWQVYNCL